MAREPLPSREAVETFRTCRQLQTRLNRIFFDIQQGDISEGDIRIVVSSDTTSEFAYRTNRRGKSSLPKIYAPDGGEINVRAQPDDLELFLRRSTGSTGVLRIELHLRRQVTAAPAPEPDVPAVPERARDADAADQVLDVARHTFSINYLTRGIYRRFNDPRTRALSIAVEDLHGAIQGFFSVERVRKDGRLTNVYQIVDAVLETAIVLAPNRIEEIRTFLRSSFAIDARDTRFRISSDEEKSAYEAEERLVIAEEEDGTAATNEMPDAPDASMSPVVDETQAVVSESDSSAVPEREPETGQPPSPKRRRPKNRPKKKTRAQEKATRARALQEEYSRVLQRAFEVIQDFSNTRITFENIDRIRAAIEPLGLMTGENKGVLRRNLSNNPEYVPLKNFLLFFRGETPYSRLRSVPLRMRGRTFAGMNAGSIAAMRNIVKLSEEMFPEVEGDAAHSAHTQTWAFQIENRDLMSYSILLFETDPMTFSAAVRSLDAEVWLDIGSGRTPSNPRSLIRSIPELNPKIRLIGVDSSYSSETASLIDNVAGRNTMDFAGADLCELKPGLAQDLPLDDESVDRAMSGFVFDKFDDRPEVQGTQQALREAARVLKSGGELRVRPILLSEIERSDSVARRYFDVVRLQEYEYQGARQEPYGLVHLIRKQLTKQQLAELKSASEAWKRQHLRKDTE